MVRRVLLVAVALAVTFTAGTVGAEPPPPPAVNARSAVLYEPVAGLFLLESDADVELAPASLAKLMTMLVAYRALAAGELAWDDEAKVSVKAWETGGSRMFIRESELVPVGLLIEGVAVVSGNDACVALAERISGTEDAFVDRMNLVARSLGLKSSHFVNSHGLDAPGQITTARDMALLSAALIAEFPESLEILSEPEFTYAEITQPNRNTLLRLDQRVDGLKTGYTSESGYSIAASARGDGLRLIAVVLGAKDEQAREREAASLLAWGFANFATVTPLRVGDRVGEVRVWQGREREVAAVALDEVIATVSTAERGRIEISFAPLGDLRAPIEKGQKVGDIQVRVGDRELATVAAVAGSDVARGNLWQRFVDWLRMLFSRD